MEARIAIWASSVVWLDGAVLPEPGDTAIMDVPLLHAVIASAYHVERVDGRLPDVDPGLRQRLGREGSQAQQVTPLDARKRPLYPATTHRSPCQQAGKSLEVTTRARNT
jgi:hypothetical protein